jgi:hypothetical protein
MNMTHGVKKQLQAGIPKLKTRWSGVTFTPQHLYSQEGLSDTHCTEGSLGHS